MTAYLEFVVAAGRPLLVEVADNEVAAGGAPKAGLQDRARTAVGAPVLSFDDAVRQAVEDAAGAFVGATDDLPSPPREVEITFGLKATGELGNIAIAKAGEANFTVRLVWDVAPGN